jgi:hypothetical protein
VAVETAAPVVASSGGITWTELGFVLRASGPARGRLSFFVDKLTVGASAAGVKLSERRLGGPGGARILDTEEIALGEGEERRVSVRLVAQAPDEGVANGGRVGSSALVLLATSAARVYDLPRQAELVGLLGKDVLAPEARLVVAVYDDRPEVLFSGTAEGLGPSIARAMGERGALGATDLAAALAWAADRARNEKHDRIVFVTDGIATAGSADSSSFVLAAKKIPRETRMDLVVPGGARNHEVLAALSDASGGRGGIVPLHGTNAALAFALRAPAASRPPLDPPGAPAWVASAALEKPAPPTLPERAAGAAVIGRYAAAARPSVAEEVHAMLDPMAGDLPPQAAKPVEATAEQKATAAVARALARNEQPAAAPPPPPPPGRLPPVAVQLIIRRNFGRLRACYIDAVRQKPGSRGRVVVDFRIDPDGSVGLARVTQTEIPHPPFISCVVRAFEALGFPESPGGPVSVTYPLAFAPADGTGPTERPMRGLGVGGFTPPPGPPAPPPPQPWLGDVDRVERAIERGDSAAAVRIAERARGEDPRSLLSYVAMADALAAASRPDDAARATASIADLAPGDAGALRMAALRSLAFPEARATAEDWLIRSLTLEPSSPDAPRVVAELYALRGNIDGALQILDGLLGALPSSRATASTRETLRGDISLLAAALASRDGSRRAELERWAAAAGAILPEQAVFVAAAVGHEAGADLDLVVADMTEARATRFTPHLATGGKLATTVGPGPEAFMSDGRRAYPYDFEVILTQRDGAFAAGATSILEHDGRGELRMIALPFVIQVEKARVNAGRLEEPAR